MTQLHQDRAHSIWKALFRTTVLNFVSLLALKLKFSVLSFVIGMDRSTAEMESLWLWGTKADYHRFLTSMATWYRPIQQVSKKWRKLLRRKWNKMVLWFFGVFSSFCSVFGEFDGRLDNVKTRVRVHNDGLCYWAAPFVFKTSCHINVQDFPYDKQMCTLKFGSWLFHSKQLDLFQKRDNAPVAQDSVDNGEWEITTVKIEKNIIRYDCCPDDLYPDITFVINLQRRSLFYTYNLVIPNLIIALLAFFSFHIPVECGERLSFVITVLLSLTVFLLLVAESIPPTSEAVPVIGLFFTSSIIEVALALIATGISLKVYYSYLYGKGLSPGLRKFLFYRVAPLLRLDTDHQNNHCTSKWRVGNPLEFVKKLTKKAKRDGDLSIYNVNAENNGRDDGETPTSLQINELNLLSLSTLSESTQGTMPERGKRKRNPLSAELEVIASAVKDHREFEKRAAECRIAAAIVDRAFMVMLIFVFFASAVIILHLPSMRKL